MAEEPGDGGALLRPGQQIRPELAHEDVAEMLGRLYDMRDVLIADLQAYDDRNYHIQVKSKQNSSWPHGYVFKVMNSLDSQKPSLFEAQTELLMYLDSHGFKCPQPVKNVDGQYFSIEELPKKGGGASRHVVRLLTYQPGQILASVPVSTQLIFQMGGLVARLDRCLQGFQHPALDKHETVWRLDAAPLVKQFLFAVEDEARRRLVEQVLDQFESDVLPHYPAMEKGTVHGDLNEQNLVCAETERGWEISAVLDVGDTQVSSYLFELAVCLCYVMLLQCPPPLQPADLAGHLLAGYCAVWPLPDDEMRMLKTCVCARLCQSLVLGAYSFLQSPDNAYVLTTAKKGWGLLRDLWSTPTDELERRWKDVIASHRPPADTA